MNPSSTRTVSVTTSWADLPSVRAEKVSILNNTGADLEVRMGGNENAGASLVLKDAQRVRLNVAANASEVQIKAAAGVSGVQIVID